MTYDVVVDGKSHRLELTKGEKTWLCKVDDQQIEVDAALTARDVMSILLAGDAFEVKRERSLEGELHLVIGSARYAVDVQDPRSLRTRRAAEGGEAGPQKITAPMPGKVVRVMVAEKDEVKVGQGVLVMEENLAFNILHGSKKRWFQSGNLKSAGEYELGICIRETEFSETGETVREYALTESDCHFEILRRYRSGSIARLIEDRKRRA